MRYSGGGTGRWSGEDIPLTWRGSSPMNENDIGSVAVYLCFNRWAWEPSHGQNQFIKSRRQAGCELKVLLNNYKGGQP